MAGSGFSAAERAAMKQRAEELAAEKKGGNKKVREEQACLDAIAALDDVERPIAERLHAIVLEVAPQLSAKTWYGFPSYADGKDVVVFYQPAAKFGTRYGTLGFQDKAALDAGTMWPTSYAITAMDEANEKLIRRLVKKATTTK